MDFPKPSGHYDPSLMPLGIPPPGHKPNFVDPENHEDVVLGTGFSFGLLALIIVSLRLYTNLSVTRKLYLDDYLCIVSWVLVSAYFGISASPPLARFSRHGYDTPLAFLDATSAKLQFASNVLLGPTLWITKVTILALYLRLFGRKTWLRWTSYITLVISTLGLWTTPVIAGVYCTPQNGAPWTGAVSLRCVQAAKVGPFLGTMEVLVDIVLIVMPLVVISHLKMTVAKKFALGGVFLFALCAFVASLVSLWYRVLIMQTNDPGWVEAGMYATVIVEGYITIMVACAPAMSSLWINRLSKTTVVTSLRGLVSRIRTVFTPTLPGKRSAHSSDSDSLDLPPHRGGGRGGEKAPKLDVTGFGAWRTQWRTLWAPNETQVTQVYAGRDRYAARQSGITATTRIDQTSAV